MPFWGDKVGNLVFRFSFPPFEIPGFAIPVNRELPNWSVGFNSNLFLETILKYDSAVLPFWSSWFSKTEFWFCIAASRLSVSCLCRRGLPRCCHLLEDRFRLSEDFLCLSSPLLVASFDFPSFSLSLMIRKSFQFAISVCTENSVSIKFRITFICFWGHLKIRTTLHFFHSHRLGFWSTLLLFIVLSIPLRAKVIDFYAARTPLNSLCRLLVWFPPLLVAALTVQFSFLPLVRRPWEVTILFAQKFWSVSLGIVFLFLRIG